MQFGINQKQKKIKKKTKKIQKKKLWDKSA